MRDDKAFAAEAFVLVLLIVGILVAAVVANFSTYVQDKRAASRQHEALCKQQGGLMILTINGRACVKEVLL